MSDDMSTTDDPNTARSIRLVAPGPSPAPAPDPADVRELVDAARAMYRELSAHYADFDFDAWSENWRYGEERHPAEIAIRMAAKALAKFPEGE